MLLCVFRNERARWISALGQNINNKRSQDRTSELYTTTFTHTASTSLPDLSFKLIAPPCGWKMYFLLDWFLKNLLLHTDIQIRPVRLLWSDLWICVSVVLDAMQVEVIRTYTAKQPDELSLQVADVVLVSQPAEDGTSALRASLAFIAQSCSSSFYSFAHSFFSIPLIFHLPVSTVSFHHALLYALRLFFSAYLSHLMGPDTCLKMCFFNLNKNKNTQRPKVISFLVTMATDSIEHQKQRDHNSNTTHASVMHQYNFSF